LPLELQVKWLQRASGSHGEQPEAKVFQITSQSDDSDRKLIDALLRLPTEEHKAWITEASRLADILERYGRIKPKRRYNQKTDTYKFVVDVLNLCSEAACVDPVIIAREPHRRKPPSPYTLDDLLRKYRRDGLLAFLRNAPTFEPTKPDNRQAIISAEAVDWVNDNWVTFSSSWFLYDKLANLAKEKKWTIPSQSWFYRNWEQMPKIVKTFYLQGEKAYVSKYAPYVPRDYSDLEPLQVLCGDHSQRDVTVRLPDGTLARPWLTLWYDLRLGLIWGWHLNLIPSAYTAGLAYADGVINFGAQPFSRIEEDFSSFIYTDHGRDYKSYNWDGKEISVHQKAMRIDGGLEFLLKDHRVGILDDFNVKHLLAKVKNPKEKPVERVFKIISEWEQNTFKEYCGRDAKHRPDTWYKLYSQHQQFIQGKRNESPFITLEQYREDLGRFITHFNSSEHERRTLGGEIIIPIDEYHRLYTTRYEISRDTLALLIMKAEKRVVGKDGVQCFQKHWFYYHEAMAKFKGLKVEIRYTDGDYRSVWVVLPNGQICEAMLITPSPLLNPNKRTLRRVAEAGVYERDLIRNFNLLTQSQIRGETTEDRVVNRLVEENRTGNEVTPTSHPYQAVIHKMTRMDRKKLLTVVNSSDTKAAEVAAIDADTSIFTINNKVEINEFDYEE